MTLREQQWDNLLKVISNGGSITDAATYSGMSREVVYKRRDADPEFAAALEKALVTPKLAAIQVVRQAMLEQWQPAAWWLERKYKDEYALKQNIEHSGHIAPEPIQYKIAETKPEMNGDAPPQIDDHSRNGRNGA